MGLLLETLERLRPAVIVAIAGVLVALIVVASYLIPVDVRFRREPRDAEAVLRKLEAQLSEVMRQERWPVTASIGAATFEKPPVSVEQMVRLVDGLMYSAKSKGKGRLEKRVIRG